MFPRRTLLVAMGHAVGLAVGGCATDGEDGDGATTAGKRVTLATVVTHGALTFTNEESWSVTVTRAVVSLGPLYYFEGEPIEGAIEARRPPVHRRWLDDLGSLVVGVAHAHPGHYAEGDARGEVLSSTSLDLVAGSQSVGGGEGVSGVVRSAQFRWGSPPEGPLAGELAGRLALVEVRAEKDGEVRHVRFDVATSDVLDASGEPRVEGCVFQEVDVQSDGTVTLTIEPSVWLAGCDFATAPTGAEGAAELVPAGTQPANAFSRGLKKGGAYRFAFEPA